MGKESLFECADCGKNFKGYEGDSDFCEGLRCVRCDHVAAIPRATPGYKIQLLGLKLAWGKVDPVPIPDCPNCKIPLRRGLRPMCPGCKGRRLITQQVLYYRE